MSTKTGSADWATNFLMGGVAASISKTVAAPIVRTYLELFALPMLG